MVSWSLTTLSGTDLELMHAVPTPMGRPIAGPDLTTGGVPAELPEALVELGQSPVPDVEALTGPGSTWHELLARLSDGESTVPPPVHLTDALPDGGWRVIGGSHGGMVVAAAPMSDSTWAVAQFDPRVDAGGHRSWHIGADPGPVVARPGRVVRRRHLGLCLLSGEVVVRFGQQEVRLLAGLTNTSDQPWVSDRLDSAYVVVQPAGAPFAGGLFPSGLKIPTLPAGRTIELEAVYSMGGDAALHPGTHELTATLISLHLTSPIGAVRFLVDSGTLPIG